MGHLLFWLVGIAILSYVAIILDRRWETILQERERAGLVEDAKSISTRLARAGETITSFATRLASEWRNQINGPHPPVDIAAFRTWLRTIFAANALEQSWLNSLNDEQMQVLYQGIATFSDDLGFDLPWLLADKPFKSPSVEQAAKEIVLNYLRSWQQATQVQADVQEMKRYQVLLADPTDKENQIFAQQLYAQLVKERLGSGIPAEVRAAGEGEEQTFILHTLQEVANQQPNEFGRALKIAVAKHTATLHPSTNGTGPLVDPGINKAADFSTSIHE